MDNFPNISTTFSEAKEKLAVSLKDMTSILEKFKLKYGPVYDACVMCSTAYEKFQKFALVNFKEENGTAYSFDFSKMMGLIIISVPDEDALLVPELGLDNILLGTWVQAWALTEYIKVLKA